MVKILTLIPTGKDFDFDTNWPTNPQGNLQRYFVSKNCVLLFLYNTNDYRVCHKIRNEMMK